MNCLWDFNWLWSCQGKESGKSHWYIDTHYIWLLLYQYSMWSPVTYCFWVFRDCKAVEAQGIAKFHWRRKPLYLNVHGYSCFYICIVLQYLPESFSSFFWLWGVNSTCKVWVFFHLNWNQDILPSEMKNKMRKRTRNETFLTDYLLNLTKVQ